MPFTFTNYGVPTFEQANPMLAGMHYGANIHQDLLNALKAHLVNQKLQAELPYAGQLAQSTAAYKNAMAKYLESPGQALRNFTPTGKGYLEPSLIPAQARYYGTSVNTQGFPQSGGQYGTETTSEGPPITRSGYESNIPTRDQESDIERTYRRQREIKTTDPVIRREAKNTQELYNLASDIDTKPLEEFAGLGGKLKYYQEATKGMAHSLGFKTEPSEAFRNYNQWMAQNKNLLQDLLRKGLGTSVTKKYIETNLSPLLDPNSQMWSDPEYVRQSVQGLQNLLRQHAAQATSAMREGVPMSVNEAKRRHEQSKKENIENSINTAHTEAGIKSIAKNMKLPNLPKREFIAWFIKQPRVVRDAIRMKLGDQ